MEPFDVELFFYGATAVDQQEQEWVCVAKQDSKALHTSYPYVAVCKAPRMRDYFSIEGQSLSHGVRLVGLRDTTDKAEYDPLGKAPSAPGAKLDQGKVRPWLCISGFSQALAEVAKVTTIGAEKYSPNGWKSVPDGAERYMEAFGRHMLALGQGEILDDGKGGTGCYHKAQMIWNLLASLELELTTEKENEE